MVEREGEENAEAAEGEKSLNAKIATFAFNLFPSPSTRGSSAHFRWYSAAPDVNSTSASDSRYFLAASDSRR